jgi:DNA-binding NarL/FixJ family response regulator
MATRLVSVDEYPLIRLGLAAAVAASEDIALVAEAGTREDALRVVGQLRPAVLTISVRLPDGDGVDTAVALRVEQPDLGVVLVGDTVDDALLVRALDADLSAYVTRSSPTAHLLTAIRGAAAHPHSFTAPGLSTVLNGTGGLLSKRELQVLTLMQEGMSLPTIARRLHLSESTVKTYTARIYHKLRVNNRSQALMTALSRGLLSVRADAA